ncbi:RagB/SusD family nutrient uptake outer membrane protein [Prevotella sp. kh1p2]|uniref:RagB/SusD family nutrient uptake outer membrane protein n=1 Tax=Prevotella sp. kh1p2 TaxID=1761883 RepID=UPI000B824835|nr:RagB/SusD family nutrient uptake outer membrane protein [Prevotella sp. kh1p2]
MKKIFCLIACFCIFASCSDSFLDTENLTKKDSGVFPKKTEDAEQILTAMYRPAMGDPNSPQSSTLLIAELMSDDRFGGGGTDDHDIQAIAAFKKTSENMYARYWSLRWEGIYRANFLLNCDDNIQWDSEAVRNQVLGETYFLRAYYYFELARAFGNVPLVLSPDPVNNAQALPAEMYGQIVSDLKNAIEKLPAEKWTAGSGVGTDGHATKWAAEALMARVFLFYTGYYNQETVTLPGEAGGSIGKQDVIAYLDDCINNSGHSLVPEFRNLWPYSAAKDYKYNIDNKLKWIGDGADGAAFSNPEVLFAVKHSGNDWSARNNDALFFSLRYQDDKGGSWENCYPYGEGWGCGTVVKELYENWPVEDPRRSGSILNVDDAKEGLVSYVDGGQNQVYDTHLWNKKYTAIDTKSDDPEYTSYLGKGIEPLYWHLIPAFETAQNPDYQSNNLQDWFVIRFSDVLLMSSELKKDVNGINQVRARVGLAPISAYSDEALQNERRWELAFEGIRYYDLLRWHKEDLITSHRSNVKVLNQAVETVVSVPFRKETKGFLPIPDQEIQKSQGVLKQNGGWASNEGNF